MRYLVAEGVLIMVGVGTRGMEAARKNGEAAVMIAMPVGPETGGE